MSISDNSYQNLSDRLMFSVSNRNSAGDNDLPHIEKGDLILSAVYITENMSETEPKEYRDVSYDMMQNFGITEDELFELCQKNANSNFKCSLEEYSYELLDGIEADGVMTPKLYTITNDYGFNGAAAMFYTPDLMDDFCDSTDTDYAVIFPISSAGVLCFGVDDVERLGLQSLYEDFIEEHLSNFRDAEVLSSNIIIYEKKTGRAETFDNEEFSFDISLHDGYEHRNEMRR